MKDILEHLRKLGVTKIAGLRFLQEPDAASARYPRKEIWCRILEEALSTKAVFMTTLDVHKCGSGSSYSGLGRSKPFEEALPGIVGRMKVKDAQAVVNIGERIPKMPDCKAAVIGDISKVDDPDVLLIVCGLRHADAISRAYAFSDGELVEGLAGADSCAVIPLCRASQKAFFVIPEKSGSCVGAAADEVMVAVPKAKFRQLAQGFLGKEALGSR